MIRINSRLAYQVYVQSTKNLTEGGAPDWIGTLLHSFTLGCSGGGSVPVPRTRD